MDPDPQSLQKRFESVFKSSIFWEIEFLEDLISTGTVGILLDRKLAVSDPDP